MLVAWARLLHVLLATPGWAACGAQRGAGLGGVVR